MTPNFSLGAETAHRIMALIGVGVFAERGALELHSVGAVPETIADMLGGQLDASSGGVTLDEHGFLASFIADTRNRLARRQRVDRDSVFFQERNEEGREFAAKVWLVQEGERRFYCIQPADETDDYKRELLQRIRSSALASSDKPVPISIGAREVGNDADTALVEELVEAIGAGLGVLDVTNEKVIINSMGRELLGLPSSMPVRIPSGRLRAYLNNTFFPRGRFAEFWAGFLATENTSTKVRRAHPYEAEISIKSVPLAESELALLQISETPTDVTRPAPASGDASGGSSEGGEIGRITGGIAHEFNNLLTPILGNLSLIEEGIDGGGSFAMNHLREGIATSLAAANRAAVLVADLVRSSDCSMLRMEETDANALAVELVETVHAGEDTRCALHLDLDDQLWPVSGDGAMLRNLIDELVKNAVQARARDGEVRVTTRNCKVGEAEAARHPELVPGDYVVIAVGDNGPGVPAELGRRIFEPFFSTKPPGEGVGLGLSAALGIARRHGGTLACASSAGEGATFSVFLPRRTGRDVTAGRTPPAPPVANVSPRTVLIVDDEPMVRQLAELALGQSGFRTLCAADGIEALEKIDAHPGQIDRILLDLTMPRLSGQETLAELARRGSKIPVVICSGYIARIDDLVAVAPGVPIRLLSKPYQPSALVEAVSDNILGS